MEETRDEGYEKWRPGRELELQFMKDSLYFVK
jgi:hypothetical protein